VIAIRVLHRGRVVRESVFPDLLVTIGRGVGNGGPLRCPVSRHARWSTEDSRLASWTWAAGTACISGRAVGDRSTAGRAASAAWPSNGARLDAPTVEDARVAALRARRTASSRSSTSGRVAGLSRQRDRALVLVALDHTRWVDLVRPRSQARWSFGPGRAFVVLKTLGRQVMADTMRALSLLTWLGPANVSLLLAAYYPPLLRVLLARQATTAVVRSRRGRSPAPGAALDPVLLGWAGGALLAATAAAWTSAGSSGASQRRPAVRPRWRATPAGVARGVPG
jgi:hypothetical protein